MADLRILTLIVLVTTAAIWDVYARRIPNVLLVLGALASCCLLAQSHGWRGMTDWFAAAALMLALYLIPYAFGILGAGDVKLMAIVGSFLGPQGALINGLVCAVSGGFLCLIVMACLPWMSKFSRIPYGVSIALGTLSYLAL